MATDESTITDSLADRSDQTRPRLGPLLLLLPLPLWCNKAPNHRHLLGCCCPCVCTAQCSAVCNVCGRSGDGQVRTHSKYISNTPMLDGWMDGRMDGRTARIIAQHSTTQHNTAQQA